MSASEAQIAAARSNGARSRGPTSAEGKAVSRRNALKHGMAALVLTPADDAAEVDRRSRAMLNEMRPATEMGTFLVKRMARLTVRVERCSDHELAANAYRALHAADAFAEARLAEVDHALGWIRAEPATHARKLRSMPEGVDRLIAELLAVHEELNTGRWDWNHGERVAHLTGMRWLEVPATRVRALSEAINGDFQHLGAEDGAGLSEADRVDWARFAMGALIDAENEMLLAHRRTLDPGAIEEDRATAAERSAFDPSKEAILARRYEAAAERGVYRALNELRRVEAEAAAGLPSEDPAEEPEDEAPGSFGAGTSGGPAPRRRPAAPAAPTPRMGQVSLIETGPGRPGMVAGSARGPA